MAAYLLMATLAWRRAYRLVLATALAALAYSLYLAHIEAHVLGVWCIYCVISLGDISLVTLLALGTAAASSLRRSRDRAA